jgi:copper chaperone CopZ
MRPITTLIGIATLAIAAPLVAQDHKHDAHDHAGMDHSAHAKAPAKAAPASSAAMTGPGAVVKVNGLICDFCAQALTKTFKKQAAVRAVQVDLNAKEVRLAFKPGQTINDATIGKLIKNAGYNVVGIKRRAS